ncbi:hypothetical protein Q7P37_004986 [Cladosporium fusiforme]
MAPKTDIDLLTSGTPNGHKELGLQYNTKKIELSKNEQKEPWFLEINPNGRIPAIVDKTSGKPKRVFEGASIQLYLCEKYDKDHKISFPYDSDEYWETVEWLVWMQSGLGPMQGQANHFYRYAPEKIPYAINRYQTETKRLYQVLNDRLASQRAAHNIPASEPGYIVGNKYTLADICNFSWVNWGEWAGVDPDESFPEIALWRASIEKRPAVEKGTNVPDEFKMKEIMRNKEKSEEYAKQSKSFLYVLIWVAICRECGPPPKNSRLERWRVDDAEQLAKAKEHDMRESEFEDVLQEFSGEFEPIKPLARRLHRILFCRDLGEDTSRWHGKLWLGTHLSTLETARLYSAMLQAFDEVGTSLSSTDVA